MEIEKRRVDQEAMLAQQALERRKLEIQQQHLDLMKEGKIRVSSNVEDVHDFGGSDPSRSTFNVATNLRLMPLFNEEDVDTFFVLFERVADSQGWPDAERTLMLQLRLRF